MPLRPSSNTGANSLCRVRRKTSRMAPAGLGEPTKGERHKTPPADRCSINRADPERDRRPKDPRSKPDTQESAQRRVQEEEPTASSASPCGTQITRPLRPMCRTKSCRPDPLSRLRTQTPPDWTAQQSEGKTHCRTIEATEEHRGPTIESPTWPNLPPPFTTIADPSPERVRLSDATATGTIR